MEHGFDIKRVKKVNNNRIKKSKVYLLKEALLFNYLKIK